MVLFFDKLLAPQHGKQLFPLTQRQVMCFIRCACGLNTYLNNWKVQFFFTDYHPLVQSYNPNIHFCAMSVGLPISENRVISVLCLYAEAGVMPCNFYFLITYEVCKKRKYCNRMSEKKILFFWRMFMFCMF